MILEWNERFELMKHSCIRSLALAVSLFFGLTIASTAAAQTLKPDFKRAADPPARVDVEPSQSTSTTTTTSNNITSGQNLDSGSVTIARPDVKPVRDYTVGEKIEGQMHARGWDHNSIQYTINNPYRNEPTTDTRHLQGGGQMNDPATAYIRKDEHYVVRNNINNDIVQISDRNNPEWNSPFNGGKNE